MQAGRKVRARAAPVGGASLLMVFMRRGYTRAFPLLVRIGFANYLCWEFKYSQETNSKKSRLARKSKKRKPRLGIPLLFVSSRLEKFFRSLFFRWYKALIYLEST